MPQVGPCSPEALDPAPTAKTVAPANGYCCHQGPQPVPDSLCHLLAVQSWRKDGARSRLYLPLIPSDASRPAFGIRLGPVKGAAIWLEGGLVFYLHLQHLQIVFP